MTITFRNALEIGSRIDRYEIEAVIGHGGFGISYCAVDTESSERVALKEFLPTELATREADNSVYPLSESHLDNFQWGLERFLEEARLLEHFHHPSIVRVRRAFEGNGTAYMVMDYEEGETLATCLKRDRTLASDALTAMTMALLDGLELVHEAGFIHRDIKPSNIYVRLDGSPVLLDFGSARQALKGKTRTLTALVSAGYAPLEQYFSRSDLQGPWTDIYGLGATLYHAISGEPPIDAVERSRGVLGSTRDILPPVADVAQSDYPPCLLAAVDHALRTDDQDRPRSIDEWRKELTGEVAIPESRVTTLATPETRAPTVRVRQPGIDPAMTHSRRIGFIGAAAVLAIAMGALGWWQWSSVDEPLGDRVIEPGSKVTEDRSEERVVTLRASLAKASSAAESSRERIEALTAKIEALEAAQKIKNDDPTPQSQASDDQVRTEPQDALIAELRLALEVANRESSEARQQAGELAARLRILEALQQSKIAEASTRRQEIDELLAAAAADIGLLRLTTPVGDNAHERYRRVLALEENNADALLGLERIVDKYIDLAGRARDNEQFREAEDYLNRASTVLPAYAALATASDKLAEARPVHNPRNRTTESMQPDSQSPDEGTVVNRKTATPEGDRNPGSQNLVIETLAVSTPAPDTQLGPLRLAIFPAAQTGVINNYGRRDLLRFIRGDSFAPAEFEVVYSYYSPEHDHEMIGDSNSLWQKDFVNKAPIVARVYELLERVKADVALMFVSNPRTAGWGGQDMYSVTVYLFDSKDRRRYVAKANEQSFKDVILQLLAQLLRDRKGNSQELPTTRSAAVDLRSPSPSTSTSPPIETGQFSVAILPHDWFTAVNVTGIYLEARDVGNAILEHLQNRTDAVVSFDYSEGSDTDEIPTKHALWQGSHTKKEPDADTVYRIGKELDVDTVLMWWSRPRYKFASWPVTLYLYDIGARREYRLDGTNVNVTEIVDAAVQKYLDSTVRFAAPDSRKAPSSPSEGARYDL
jgi:serine/threonine protein kinase